MTSFKRVQQLCRALDSRHVHYVLSFARSDALMLTVAVPGERWEIEFFEDGHIELERFVSKGVEEDPAADTKLLCYFDEA